MRCKPCYYTHHIQREGGQFALCWQHKKTKCRGCKELSAGKPYCVKCEYGNYVAQMRGEATRLHFDDDHEFLQEQLRKEKLWESKRHAHRAIEILFRAFALTLEAIWGGIKQPQAQEQKEIIKPEFREAA